MGPNRKSGCNINGLHASDPRGPADRLHIHSLLCRMCRYQPVLGLSCHVSAVLNEEPCKIYMATDRCLMQQSGPFHILRRHVRAVVDKEPRTRSI